MTMTQLVSLQYLVGKTITKVDDSAANMITFTFDDGTTVVLESQLLQARTGLIGIVASEVNPEELA